MNLKNHVQAIGKDFCIEWVQKKAEKANGICEDSFLLFSDSRRAFRMASSLQITPYSWPWRMSLASDASSVHLFDAT
jgi:hypothetical protein